MRASEFSRDFGAASGNSEDTVVLADGTEVTSITYEDGKIVIGTEEVEAIDPPLGLSSVMHQAVQSPAIKEEINEEAEADTRDANWQPGSEPGQGQEYHAGPEQPINQRLGEGRNTADAEEAFAAAYKSPSEQEAADRSAAGKTPAKDDAAKGKSTSKAKD